MSNKDNYNNLNLTEEQKRKLQKQKEDEKEYRIGRIISTILRIIFTGH